MSHRWVVAFSGPRDYYQLPLALHEADALDRLVTDFYAPDLGPLEGSPLGRFRHRRVGGLPLGRVRPTPSVLAHRLRMRRAGTRQRVERWDTIDATIARAAGRRARASGANLLLYKGYAREAFGLPGLEDRTKGLFVYHPHGEAVRELLARDAALYPEVRHSYELHRAEIEISDSTRLDDELALADFVVCASSYTVGTLPERLLRARPLIAPYGVFPPTHARTGSSSTTCTFLFVGQGVQRKGLHHLLRAWRDVGPRDAELLIVASGIDPGIESLVSEGVTILGRQRREELDALFSRADAFVMPSLVEGFGLVYLEALAAGCFVIGTRNTGLPDLDLPPWAGVVIDAGDLDALGQALVLARDRHHRRELPHGEIAGLAAGMPWTGFRERIREICATWDRAGAAERALAPES